MDDIVIVAIVVIGIPWLVLHYITKWKTAPALTDNDEAMLEELYALAKRLDERMDTVERLTAEADSNFTAPRLVADQERDNNTLDELEQMMRERKSR